VPKVNARYVDTPSVRPVGLVDEVPLKNKKHSEDAVRDWDYSSRLRRSCVKTFTESLILAQDERWRRA
jgi:hypothetical protein